MTENGDCTTISFEHNEPARLLFGPQNENIKALESLIGLKIDSRGQEVCLRGSTNEVEFAASLLEQLYALAERQVTLNPADLARVVRMLRDDPALDLKALFLERVLLPAAAGRKQIAPKSPAQRAYLEAIRKNDMVFAVGPAGTGKTYLAVAMAVAAVLRKEYRRIILTRPAVEAGEKLGFLPGDLAEKINPYLRPLYDALYDMLDQEKGASWVEDGIVEVAPLAFMRGRTLNDSFIILDEAQNTTPEQMKMFLTRMGFGSKVVVTGDITQIDLPGHVPSGLIQAVRYLEGLEGIHVARFGQVDVVRHPLVARIVAAYDTREESKHG